jgi:hypothetical protein
LISFEFKDKYANDKIRSLISRIINIGDFEKWKITNKLKSFIDKPEHTKDLLNDFYDLFFGFPNENPYEQKGYKFLQNLGLNCLYWIDEGYLKSSYGDSWIEYYKKYEAEIPLYHEQLVPIASLILSALTSDEIEIYGKGDYKISDFLKEKLESDKIIKLKHKE